ncbi:MAG: response regulator transcription factor, partial [Clostridiales bacterium]|nr:response regulator transcription factor [Clostridiales bacterium]
MSSRILIIEDDADIRDGIRLMLESEGYEITCAGGGSEGLTKLDNDFDLVILDVMMPGMDGFRTCEMIRRVSTVPILFLTAKSSDSDKVKGLSAGGDDYLTKPFSHSELVGRVKALVRRYRIYKGRPENTEDGIHITEKGGIVINEDYNEVTVDGREVNLSDIEYGILLLLMKSPGKIFSAEKIYESVWHDPYLYSSNSTVMVHIRKLRVKIEKDPQEPVHIKTVWGK